MIEVRSLTKNYGKIRAIQNINFTAQKEEIFGFLGPNGAGKTTTLRIITCFLRATSGTVLVDGLDVATDSLEVRKKLGYLPENSPLYPDMRVEEYLSYRLKLKRFPRAHRKHRMEEVIDKCSLGSVRKQLIGQLSKGYRQRVGFADAISHKPQILILDEPTAGMDPGHIVEVRNLIRELSREHTILFSTHNLFEVDQLCKRVVIINRGQIVADATTDELRQKATVESAIHLETNGPRQEVEQELEQWDEINKIESSEKDNYSHFQIHPKNGDTPEFREKIFSMVVEKNWKLITLARREKSLEEIFMQIINSR